MVGQVDKSNSRDNCLDLPLMITILNNLTICRETIKKAVSLIHKKHNYNDDNNKKWNKKQPTNQEVH